MGAGALKRVNDEVRVHRQQPEESQVFRLKAKRAQAATEGPDGPFKHEERKNHGFWNASCLGPLNQNEGSLCLCSLWAPKSLSNGCRSGAWSLLRTACGRAPIMTLSLRCSTPALAPGKLA